MAEGRMLKKAISTSRRLADLQSDSARMLYTWIIPHLDIEGRFYADPEMVKGSVVPRIKSFTLSKIEECLSDMHKVGLILVYKVDGDTYLQLRKFEDHQNLRRDKEAQSNIPAPNEMDNSGTTPGLLPECSGTTPAEEKRREEKVKSLSSKTLSDEEWIKTLEDNPIYDGIEVRVLYGKMIIWCNANGKKPTRRRFVNWLNREDKPLKKPKGSW